MAVLAIMTAWHEKMFQNSQFTQKITSLTILLAVLLGIAASFMNFQARHINWQIWEQNKSEFFFEETPLFTTMDAGYFLGIAGYLKSGRTVNEYHSLRSFPRNQYDPKLTQKTERSPPLLATTIAYFAEDSSPQSLLTTGNKIIPYTAIITAIAVIIAFGVTGYWLEASVAAAGGGLSIAYYWRSSMGRIDTDQLNLGFMYFMFAMVMCAGRAKDIKWGLFFTVMAGLTARLFDSWYGKPELIIMAAFALFWLTLIVSRDWRRILGLSALFVVISGVGLRNPFESTYLLTELNYHNFVFSSVISTVTEASQIAFTEILTRMTGSVFMSVFCLLGMVFWAVRHPVMAVAYAPLAGFALFTIVLGNRALFYSAPFFWFGGAYLAVLITRLAVYQFSTRLGNLAQAISISASAAACAALLLFIWVTGPVNQLARPSIPVPIIKAMSEIKPMSEGENSVVASWWDYGYASMLMNGLPTFTDPGTHRSNTNYFIADALLSSNPVYTADTLRFLARGGLSSLEAEVENRTALTQIMIDNRDKPAPAVYLMLTDQMTGWIPSISKIGRWDIDLGAPILAKGHKTGQNLVYNFLNCADSKVPGLIRCNDSAVDLREGKIDGNSVLDLVVEAHGGRLIGSKRFRDDALNMFQIMKDRNGEVAKVALLHEELFYSSFNQMFHLGRFDTKNFKLVYDDYPHARIFKLLPAPR